jgi:hypothetical protein
MLQAQQSQYVADKWAKLDQSLYNQSVYYEPNRLAAYYDYESMEFTPEISAALDIYAEESTTLSEKGEILTIFSESDRVKTILEDLFINKFTGFNGHGLLNGNSLVLFDIDQSYSSSGRNVTEIADMLTEYYCHFKMNEVKRMFSTVFHQPQDTTTIIYNNSIIL